MISPGNHPTTMSFIDQSLLYSIIDQFPSIIHIMNEHGRILYINQAVTKSLGYQQDEMVGKNILDFIPRNQQSATILRMKAKLKNPDYSNPNYLHIPDKDGNFHDLVSVSLISFNSEGQKYLVIHSREITDHLKMVNLLETNEQKFHSIFKHAPVGIVFANDQNQIVDCNKAFRRMIGYSKKELKKKTFFELTHPDDLELSHKTLAKISNKKNAASVQLEKRYLKKDGSVMWGKLNVAHHENDRGKKFNIAIIEDITIKKQVDEKKDAFLSVVAHELKTPLTTSKLAGQLLSRQLKNLNVPETVLARINQLDQELDRVNRIVNDLLDVTRFETGKLTVKRKKFDFIFLIRKTIDEIKTLKPTQQIRLNLSEICSVCPIKADEDRIRQVLINLFTNAIKHSPANSTIDLYLEKVNQKANFSIHNDGPEIPRDKITNIFNKFYQVEESSPHGFGLGLYISREIINQHKGRIWVKSQKNKGSTFYFSLPLGK